MPLNPVIALIAGESSGDQLGAALIRELRKIYPTASFVGIGGRHMKAEGFDAWWDCEELAVMGLTEVLSHLPRLLKLRKALRKRLLVLKPDIFVGIDAPDFNLPVEKTLRDAGIPTVHYVSPSVWAWRRGRAKNIGESADLVLCLFPFEPAIYDEFGVNARFIGHPMADEIPMENDKVEARKQLGLNPDKPCIALLPGSRSAEARLLSPHLLDAAELLVGRNPETSFVAPMAGENIRSIFNSSLEKHPEIDCLLTDGEARQTMAAADLVLCASGTAALETMLVNRPMVVIYRISPVSWKIVQLFKLVKSRFFSLPNALADEELVPELAQNAGNGKAIAREAIAWLDDKERMEGTSRKFAAIHLSLRKNAAACAAASIHALIKQKNES